jgi:uncharacterized protein YegL
MPAPRVTSNSPWHLVFILDDSGSMSGEPANKLNEAIDGMIEEMKLMSHGVKPWFRISIIVFGTSPRIIAEVQSEQQVDKSKAAALSGSSGGTDMAAALLEAVDVLRRNPGATTDFDPYVFLLTDGNPDEGTETKALSAADVIKNMELASGKPRLIAVGLGSVPNMNLLARIASNPELAKHLARPDDLIRFFPAIGTVVTSAGGTAAVDQAIMDI